MRKRYYLILILFVLTASGIVYMNQMKLNSVCLEVGSEMWEGVTPYITVSMEHSENRICLWQDEEDGKAYFFLPSCVSHHKVRFGDLGGSSVRVDGELFEGGDSFAWEEGREYQMQITNDAYEVRTYAVTFMKSENIPAVFINTESGGMEYLNADKDNEETGDICVVREDGNTEYQGTLERISGRGNSTWEYEKKPYAIKLSEKYPLCGLDKSDRWRLLALWREGSKMDNKIAMDLAQEMGMAYSVQGTWVDLYLNGEYNGNYLLTESVSVGDGRVDIYDLEKDNKQYNANIEQALRYEEDSRKGYLIDNGDNITGGYLIEKDHPKHYEVEPNGFVTTAGSQFTINAPSHASAEQVEYISGYVDNIEQMVLSGQQEIWEYLDADSFAKRFILDEVSLNTDTGLTSMYFYKERNDDTLYSGPTWDYDNAFGERNTDSERGYDYEYTVLDICENSSNTLNWYAKLYETPEMQQRVIKIYRDLMPYFDELLDRGIDEYADMIDASVKMDRVLWADKNIQGDSTGKYADYYLNIKYMKYFIAKRLNWLCARWGVNHEEFAVPSSGEMHLVTFANYEGVVGTMEVMDGTELENPPEYDASVFQGWADQYTGEKYRRQIPIYDDIVFYNGRW